MTDKSSTQTLDRLLTPSWLSGLIAITVGLVVTLGVILAFNFNNGQVRQQLVALQNISAPSTYLSSQTAVNGVKGTVENTWPLLAFWMVVGIIVFYIVESVITATNNAVQLKRELNYVHAQRDQIIKTTLISIFISVAAAIIWIIFIRIFFKRIIPYVITAAYASASNFLSVNGILDALLAFAVIVLSLHFHTIMLRLVLRRPRLFSSI